LKLDYFKQKPVKNYNCWLVFAHLKLVKVSEWHHHWISPSTGDGVTRPQLFDLDILRGQ